jgi:uncharacterized protein YbjQ (UPF0145 family)
MDPMVISTFPNIPGKTFEVITVVLVHGAAGDAEKLIQQVSQKASSLGANGIIDLKIHCVRHGYMSGVGGGGDSIIVTGTAVKIH